MTELCEFDLLLVSVFPHHNWDSRFGDYHTEITNFDNLCYVTSIASLVSAFELTHLNFLEGFSCLL